MMDDARKKILDFSSIGLANIIAAGTAAIFWFYIAAEIGPENFGELMYLLSIASLVSALALFGSEKTVLVFSAKNIDVQKTIYAITLTTSSIGAIVIFMLFFNISLSFTVIGFSLLVLITTDLLGKKLYREYSKYIIIQKVLLVVLGIGFYYLMGESGILVGIALSHGFYIIKLIRTMKVSKFNLGFLKEKKNFILNNFALSITGAFYGSIDKIIIAPLLGFGILGNYSLGLQFFSLLTLLPTTAINYLIPQDSSGIQNKKLKKIIVLISIIFAILGFTIGPIAISYFFPKFNEADDVIRIISLAIIPTTIINVMYFSKFWAHEMNRKILFPSILVVTVQVFLILTLGPVYGINGVAGALVISITCGTILAAVLDRYGT